MNPAAPNVFTPRDWTPDSWQQRVALQQPHYDDMGELARAGVKEPGAQARSMIGLTNPQLDWVQLAAGLGVPGVRVGTADALVKELRRGLEEPGPHLIEMIL